MQGYSRGFAGAEMYPSRSGRGNSANDSFAAAKAYTDVGARRLLEPGCERVVQVASEVRAMSPGPIVSIIKRKQPADSVVIRKLRAGDIARFFDPGDRPLGEKWLGLQERDEMYVAVAEIDGAAIGRSSLLYNFKGDPPNAYSFASSVSAEWRSHGIGSALVRHLEGVARSRGMYLVVAHAAHDNPRSALWREQMGYRRMREETIQWDEPDGRHIEMVSWRFERTFTPPASYRVRRWVKKKLSNLRRRFRRS